MVENNLNERRLSIRIVGTTNGEKVYEEKGGVGKYFTAKIEKQFDEIEEVEFRFNRSIGITITDTTTVFDKIYLSKTITAPPVYEPYVGGIPSPNPDDPQEIRR